MRRTVFIKLQILAKNERKARGLKEKKMAKTQLVTMSIQRALMLEQRLSYSVGTHFWHKSQAKYMSRLMRLWHFSSSVNSFFKRPCADIQWD